MRDYEFGNHLADLRKAHGYSQFQLGTLVGVTDKAVSKWENGAAKPKAAVIMKLAAVLGVDMEEILIEAQEEYPKDGKALAEKKKALWLKAESRMKEIFGNIPDLTVRNRFLMEKNALNGSDIIVLFETMSLLKTYADSQYSIFSARAMTSCSFIAWLLGATSINPLPPHYCCPKCHRIVYQHEYKCGWDLPEKTCEVCGSDLYRDGHDLPFEICACGTSNALVTLDCNMSENLIDRGWEIALKHLSHFYSFKRYECKLKEDRGFRATRIYLFPKKAKVMNELDRIPALDEEGYLRCMGNIPSLLLAPVSGQRNRNGSFIGNLIRPEIMTSALRSYLDNQRKDYDEYAKEMADNGSISVSQKQFPEETREIKTFAQFVDVLCAVSGTYTVDGPENLAASLGLDDYHDLPLSREDIWHLVCSCSGLGNQATGIASEIVYKTRRGLYSKSINEDDRKLFEQLNLPPWFANFVQKIRYLFPRSNNISYAYEILQMQ